MRKSTKHCHSPKRTEAERSIAWPVRRTRPIPLISRPQPLGLNRGNLKHPAVKHRSHNRNQQQQTPQKLFQDRSSTPPQTNTTPDRDQLRYRGDNDQCCHLFLSGCSNRRISGGNSRRGKLSFKRNGGNVGSFWANLTYWRLVTASP
jgi:hypothetical protein